MRKVEPMLSHMASYCCCYSFKMFCYDGIGATTIYAITQMVFAETPGTCKYKYHIKMYYPIKMMNRLI